MTKSTKAVEWTETAEPGLRRAYTPTGASLWLRASGEGFIISNGQTIWESETAGTQKRVEEEAKRLDVLGEES